MSTYPKGNLIRISVSFTDTGGADVDPDAVVVQVRSPLGVVTTATHGVDAAVKKDSTGHYHLDVDAAVPGPWRYRWYATGNGQAAMEDEFVVSESAFV